MPDAEDEVGFEHGWVLLRYCDYDISRYAICQGESTLMAVAPTIGGLLGERVRELRKKRGLTQVEFAALCGVPQSRISTIENGSRVPNVETVIRLARALGCKVTALMSVFDKS